MNRYSIERHSNVRSVSLGTGLPVAEWLLTSTSSAARPWPWRTTRDIDAVFEPHGVVLQEAEVVARELGLPRWWLNEQASVYVAPGGDPDAARVFDHPGLRVVAASPRHLLAMKVLAARRRDAGDIKFLVRHLGLASVSEVLKLCAEVFPDEPVQDGARLVLEDICERVDPTEGSSD